MLHGRSYLPAGKSLIMFAIVDAEMHGSVAVLTKRLCVRAFECNTLNVVIQIHLEQFNLSDVKLETLIPVITILSISIYKHRERERETEKDGDLHTY